MAEKKKGFDLNSLLNTKSKGAAVQAEGPAQATENAFDVAMPVSYTHLTLPTTPYV